MVNMQDGKIEKTGTVRVPQPMKVTIRYKVF